MSVIDDKIKNLIVDKIKNKKKHDYLPHQAKKELLFH